jgi:hypothetical protein
MSDIAKHPLSLFTLVFLSLVASGCATTPETIDPKLQQGFVYLGVKGGNRIFIPNLDHLPAYDFYKKMPEDTVFVFVDRKRRPPVPMRSRIGGYSIEWIDDDNSSLDVLYKVDALNDDDQKWCDVILKYQVPKPDTSSH